MYIWSQDKSTIIDIQGKEVQVCENEIVVHNESNALLEVIGRYTSRERALEVVERIALAIVSPTKIFRMPNE